MGLTRPPGAPPGISCESLIQPVRTFLHHRRKGSRSCQPDAAHLTAARGSTTAAPVFGGLDRRGALLTMLMGAVAAPGGARSSAFPGGVVSVTYDDGFDSHLDLAIPALNARGLRGTFYLTLENVRARAAEWQQIAARGHELANHTVTHPCDISGNDWRSYGSRQIEPLNRFLDAWAAVKGSRDFAYPCDVTDLGPGSPNRQLRRFEAILRSEHIASARTSEGAPNSEEWARKHPFRLQALAAGFDATTLPQFVDYIERARSLNRWAILVFHNLVRSKPVVGEVLASIHNEVLDRIVAMNIHCRPVREVMQEIGGSS